MNARELNDSLNYTGMVRGIRNLAVTENLAPIEEIATMTELDICELVLDKYNVVYAESEEIGLVKKSDTDTYNKIIKQISR